MELENTDIPWLYAAYRLNAFKDFMPEGLNEEQFIDSMLNMTANFDEIYVGLAPLQKGESKRRGSHQIMGIAGVNFLGKNRAEAHAIWMPWASDKNKLEVAAKFFAEMRREKNVILPVKEDAKNFFRHLCRLGLMRHVGRIDRYFDDGATALLFHTLGVKNVE